MDPVGHGIICKAMYKWQKLHNVIKNISKMLWLKIFINPPDCVGKCNYYNLQISNRNLEK